MGYTDLRFAVKNETSEATASPFCHEKKNALKENEVANEGKPRPCFARIQKELPHAQQLCRVLCVGFQTAEFPEGCTLNYWCLLYFGRNNYQCLVRLVSTVNAGPYWNPQILELDSQI